MYNPSYTTKRNDIISVLPANLKKILDVGCSTGTLGEEIKKIIPGCKIWGIEFDKAMGNEALLKLDKVFIDNAESLLKEEKISENFDCIIFADILEHLYDPWEVIKKSRKLLNDGGIIIASIPNIRYYKVFVEIFLKGYWPRDHRGIFDKTHLRYFTKKNIDELFNEAGLKIIRVKRNFRLIDRKSTFNKISNFTNIPFVKDFFTFQFIVVAG